MSEIVLTCDTVVIGAGTAGVEAFKAATDEGVNCVLVESGPLGTSAKRSGDTPISTLMAAGRVSHALMELEKHGIKGLYELGVGLDLDQVLNNVRAVRAKDTSEVLSFIYRIAEEKRLIGKARFLDAHSLMVNESHLVRFKTAVVATGATSIIPYELNQYSVQALTEQATRTAREQAERSGSAPELPYPQVTTGGVFTPQELFELDHLPNSIAIFGSNREGLQIGQALAYLGVKVVVFGQHKIWKLTDESVIDAAIDAFKDRFDLVLESFTTAIDKYEQGFGIYYMDGTNYENILGVDTILVANVRYPKLEGLNIRSLGVEFERSGCIKIDPKTMQTSVPQIFAAGEVTALDLTIVNCRNDGKVAGINAARQALSMPELPPLEQVAPESEHEARYMGRGPATAQPAAAHAYAQVLGLTSVKRAQSEPAADVTAPSPEAHAEQEATPERVIEAAEAVLAADLAGEQVPGTAGTAGAPRTAGAVGALSAADAAGATSATGATGAVSAAEAARAAGTAGAVSAAEASRAARAAEAIGATGGAGAAGLAEGMALAGTRTAQPGLLRGRSALYRYRDSAGQEVDAAALAAPEAEVGFDVYEVRRNTLEQWAHKLEAGQNVAPPPQGEITPELQAEIKAQREAGRSVPFVERLPDFSLDILHTDPELALVGLSYEEVKERARHGYPFVSSEVRATEGRYRITHQEGGLLRLYCDEASHVVLGAEMCLHDAGHLAHFLAQAIASQRTVEQLYALPYFSSSYEEIIKSAAEQALKNIARKGQGL